MAYSKAKLKIMLSNMFKNILKSHEGALYIARKYTLKNLDVNYTAQNSMSSSLQ
jgi:hypothetical protein